MRRRAASSAAWLARTSGGHPPEGIEDRRELLRWGPPQQRPRSTPAERQRGIAEVGDRLAEGARCRPRGAERCQHPQQGDQHEGVPDIRLALPEGPVAGGRHGSDDHRHVPPRQAGGGVASPGWPGAARRRRGEIAIEMDAVERLGIEQAGKDGKVYQQRVACCGKQSVPIQSEVGVDAARLKRQTRTEGGIPELTCEAARGGGVSEHPLQHQVPRLGGLTGQLSNAQHRQQGGRRDEEHAQRHGEPGLIRTQQQRPAPPLPDRSCRCAPPRARRAR